MKNNLSNLDDEVDKTLRSIDGMERASPPPFFLTRVEARLAGRGTARLASRWFLRPAWVAASLGLVLLLNLSAVVYAREQIQQQEQEQEQDAVGLSADWRFDTTALDW
ncbi:hypothetical protein [Fibrella arboris]|uniref:hypothetical protein n=1 Tax=Fibrella arboris TaxID=3242486 RepID=UPI00351FEAC9